jgi:hypothetical protein
MTGTRNRRKNKANETPKSHLASADKEPGIFSFSKHPIKTAT